MSETDPNLTPLADRLPADVYYHLVYTLRRILPKPPTTNPKHLTRRDNALIGRLAALNPANPIEAELAADYIAATEHAHECMRLALDSATPLQLAVKCRAQANSMMRQADGKLNRLERMQAQRRKLKGEEARDRAAWNEHCVIGLISQAFAEQPEEPDAELLEQLEPEENEPDPETLTPEEQKATIYRKRAALIRKLNEAINDPTFKDTVAHYIAHPDASFTAELNREPGPPR